MFAFLCGMQKWGYTMTNNDIKSIFYSGETKVDFNVEFKDTVSVDETLCIYDYADIILRGAENGKGK